MITFTIPRDAVVLRATAAMLEAVAASMGAAVTASASRPVCKEPALTAPYGVEPVVVAAAPTPAPVAPLPTALEVSAAVLGDLRTATHDAPDPVAEVPPVAPVAEVPPVAPTTPADALAAFGAAIGSPVAPVDVTNEDVDGDGLPWDGRIHSSGKSKMKNGTWKRKRGASPELVATVESELRGERPDLEATVEDALRDARPDLDAPAAVIIPPAPAVVAPPAPAVPAPPAPAADVIIPPAPAVVAPAPAISSFPALMEKIVKGGYSQEKIQAACDASGVASIMLVAPRVAAEPELVPAIAAALDA